MPWVRAKLDDTSKRKKINFVSLDGTGQILKLSLPNLSVHH